MGNASVTGGHFNQLDLFYTLVGMQGVGMKCDYI
jgi:hypothetical protein